MIECHLLVLVPVLEHDKVSALLALLSPAATIILMRLNLLGSLLQHTVLADHGTLRALALLERVYILYMCATLHFATYWKMTSYSQYYSTCSIVSRREREYPEDDILYILYILQYLSS